MRRIHDCREVVQNREWCPLQLVVVTHNRPKIDLKLPVFLPEMDRFLQYLVQDRQNDRFLEVWYDEAECLSIICENRSA